jgi:hypothetical protein
MFAKLITQVENNLTREAEKKAKERRANFAKTNANLILTLENNNVVSNNNNNSISIKESDNNLIKKCLENQERKEPKKGKCSIDFNIIIQNK